MTKVIPLFPQMMLLRTRPQDLPASDTLVVLAVLASALAGMTALHIVLPLQEAFAQVGVDLLLLAGLLLAGLRLTGRGERFRQSFAALCGTGAIFALLAWPLLAVIVREGDPAVVAMLLLWTLYAWNLLVIGHILRHAFDTGWPGGLLLALGYVIISTLVLHLLFSQPDLRG